jgi:hypothetical protein
MLTDFREGYHVSAVQRTGMYKANSVVPSLPHIVQTTNMGMLKRRDNSSFPLEPARNPYACRQLRV